MTEKERGTNVALSILEEVHKREFSDFELSSVNKRCLKVLLCSHQFWNCRSEREWTLFYKLDPNIGATTETLANYELLRDCFDPRKRVLVPTPSPPRIPPKIYRKLSEYFSEREIWFGLLDVDPWDSTTAEKVSEFMLNSDRREFVPILDALRKAPHAFFDLVGEDVIRNACKTEPAAALVFPVRDFTIDILTTFINERLSQTTTANKVSSDAWWPVHLTLEFVKRIADQPNAQVRFWNAIDLDPFCRCLSNSAKLRIRQEAWAAMRRAPEQFWAKLQIDEQWGYELLLDSPVGYVGWHPPRGLLMEIANAFNRLLTDALDDQSRARHALNLFFECELGKKGNPEFPWEIVDAKRFQELLSLPDGCLVWWTFRALANADETFWSQLDPAAFLPHLKIGEIRSTWRFPNEEYLCKESEAWKCLASAPASFRMRIDKTHFSEICGHNREELSFFYEIPEVQTAFASMPESWWNPKSVELLMRKHRDLYPLYSQLSVETWLGVDPTCVGDSLDRERNLKRYPNYVERPSRTNPEMYLDRLEESGIRLAQIDEKEWRWLDLNEEREALPAIE